MATTSKSVASKSTATKSATKAQDEQVNARLPKRAKADDVLIPGKPYTPRKNTKFSTRNQWAMLEQALADGSTVQAIVNAAAARVKEHGVSVEASVTDAGYLDYVLSRGWVVVKSDS